MQRRLCLRGGIIIATENISLKQAIEGYDRIEQGAFVLLSVIDASGFSETDQVKKAQELGAGMYLKKPYTLETLGLAVKAELQKHA